MFKNPELMRDHRQKSQNRTDGRDQECIRDHFDIVSVVRNHDLHRAASTAPPAKRIAPSANHPR